MGDDRDGAKSAWTEISFLGLDGYKTITVKVNVYQNLEGKSLPGRFWEVRRFVNEIGYASAEGVYKIVKLHMDSWKEESKLSGLKWSENFRPSARSAKALKVDLSKCSPEFEVSTPLMLVLMLRSLASTYSRKRAAACLSFCTAFLQRVLVSKRDAEQLIETECDADVLQLCDHETSDGRCTHIADVVNSRYQNRAQSVETRVIKFLLHLRRHVNDGQIP